MAKIIDKFKTINWWVFLRDLLLISVVVVAISAWQSRDMLDADGSVAIDNHQLVSLTGETHSLLADDKPTLIYFFAPWCNICDLSIGNLDYLDAEKLNIVTVALDYQNTENVEEFVAKHDVSSQVLLGHNGLKDSFQIKGYPTYYLLNNEQKVVGKSYGYSSALGLKLRELFSRG